MIMLSNSLKIIIVIIYDENKIRKHNESIRVKKFVEF